MVVVCAVLQTRSAATRAIQGGRFRLDGTIMAKPHRQAVCGQVLTFVQGGQVRVVRILALGSRRGPGARAALLYEDLEPPVVPKTVDYRPRLPVLKTVKKGTAAPQRLRRQTDRLKGGI